MESPETICDLKCRYTSLKFTNLKKNQKKDIIQKLHWNENKNKSLQNLVMATSFQNKTMHVVLFQLLVSICLFCSHFSLRLWNIHGSLAVAESRSIIRKEKITSETNNFLIGTHKGNQTWSLGKHTKVFK